MPRLALLNVFLGGNVVWIPAFAGMTDALGSDRTLELVSQIKRLRSCSKR
jgi:hypothetical protein